MSMANRQALPECNAQQRQAYTEQIRAWNRTYEAEHGKARQVFVMTFGCQQNEADSEKLAGMAVDMGYRRVDTPDAADLILVNTCAIREHAEEKALSIIGQYKHLKAKNPELIIGVCGCMVTQEHRANDIKHRYPYVSFVLGTAALHRLPQLIAENMAQRRRLYCLECDGEMTEGLPIDRSCTYRAWVSVMYGCNNFCSYCIVPYVRGRERSRRKEDIVAEVKALVEKGYKDITLLGQNVNSYGKGYGKNEGLGYDFADLLEELDAIPGDYWLRFMTSHPKDASRKLIDVMAAGTHIAHQFHLPMQSGSDAILKAMNRHYDTARYLDTVSYMREKMPDVTLTSDIIVGFPGESDGDFEGTLNMLNTVKFDMLYSFIYSMRKGTPAAEMEQIPDAVKGERFKRLLDTQNAIAATINQTMVGNTVRVLCDGISKNNSSVYSGRTEGNKIVFFDGTPDMEGRFVEVKIDRAEAFALYGQVK